MNNETKKRYFIFFYQVNDGRKFSNGIMGFVSNNLPSEKYIIENILETKPDYQSQNVQITSFNEVSEGDYSSYFDLENEGVE